MTSPGRRRLTARVSVVQARATRLDRALGANGGDAYRDFITAAITTADARWVAQVGTGTTTTTTTGGDGPPPGPLRAQARARAHASTTTTTTRREAPWAPSSR